MGIERRARAEVEAREEEFRRKKEKIRQVKEINR